MRIRRWASGLIASLTIVLGAPAIAQNSTNSGSPAFVGSQACQACHINEFNDWKTSHHHAAMQPANAQTVLGDFSGVTFTNQGATSTFFKKDDRYFVRTEGPDGNLADFEVIYTFGVTPLQQYLIAMPGGRFQAFGVVWDTRSKDQGGQRWYHLYPDRALKPGDPLHWTGIDQNWNYQCAWCHSTNLQKNYDAKSKTFQTTWSEINVGCESCHGPASDHISWTKGAKQPGDGKGFAVRFDERKQAAWVMGENGQAHRSAPRTTAKEIEVCARCHGRRQQFSSSADSMRSLLDAFRPSMIEPGLFHADGQQRDEVFDYASFAQSKMNAAGVTCSDCHNPHSGELVADGNAVCSKCHAPARFDTPAHHHHAAGSTGSKCASCHMPTTVYMGVDARHDHSMRIPRPDRSVMIGTPNACTMCHTDMPASKARDAVKVWYPSPKPGAQDFAEAFDLSDRGAPGAEAALIKVASSPASSPIARASALARLGRTPSSEALALAVASLKIDDPMVRNAAIAIIAGADPATRAATLSPLLQDPTQLVRMDVARALAGEPEQSLDAQQRADFDKAVAEYIAGQLHNAERPESQTNLGGLYRDRGMVDEARAAYRTAIELDATFVAASVSLADLERTAGNERGAEDILRAAIAANSASGPVQHALGLSLIRQKRTAEAMPLLAEAVQNAPEDPRFGYVYAIALHSTGEAGRAREVLLNTLARHPYDRDSLLALTSYDVEAKQFSSALEFAQRLLELEPANPQFMTLVEGLKRKSR
jgi:predicted CXXCH cytochrome family protein